MSKVEKRRKTTNQHCCVPLCTNDTRYSEEGKFSFHQFPTEEALRKKWIAKIRRDVGPDFQITKNTLVCSAHFLDEDIKKTLAGKRMLVRDAVPTLFAWTKTPSKRVGPQKRARILTVTNQTEAAERIECAPTENIPQDQVPMATFDHDYNVPKASIASQLEAAQIEVERLQQENMSLKMASFGLQRFSCDFAMINFYTGFKDYQTLLSIFNSLKPTATTMIRWTQMQRHASNVDKIRLTNFNEDSHSLPLIDQFFMFLCRVRQGFPEQDLAVRFSISQSSVSRLLITWANYLYAMLGSLELWPSRKIINDTMPDCFKLTYPSTRVILDCTEIKVQTPSSKVLNSEIYSNYKSHSTFKSLVGITPCGTVSFVSSLYTGAISDKEITARSGIISLIEANDHVMADKGFLISDLLETKKAHLVIPPFLGSKGKFSKEEVASTHEIARLRIHVERAIRRVKEYHIFDGVIPLNLAATINQIWTVCVILTNFRGPLF